MPDSDNHPIDNTNINGSNNVSNHSQNVFSPSSTPSDSQSTKALREAPSGSKWPKSSKNRSFWLKIVIPILILILVAAGIGGKIYYNHWYQDNLKPLSDVQKRIVVKISPGLTASDIGQLLQKSHVIRSGNAFYLYTKSSGERGNLQAGTYMFSPNQSVKEIVSMLSKGQTNIFNVTILPGQNLSQIKQQLLQDGFSDSSVDQALATNYNSPLFNGRPAGASLEGYIFPDTYQIDADTTATELLQKSFDNFYAKLENSGLTDGVPAQNLNLFEAITLASIIQKEDSVASVQPQIAQVFLSRLQKGMVLGSDVTAIYGAQNAGQNLSPSDAVALDTPYNTRIHSGLPPGPIANFNLSALQAVANPASGDYLYFVAGDNGQVYFAQTEQEHEQNVEKYCQKLCQQ